MRKVIIATVLAGFIAGCSQPQQQSTAKAPKVGVKYELPPVVEYSDK